MVANNILRTGIIVSSSSSAQVVNNVICFTSNNEISISNAVVRNNIISGSATPSFFSSTIQNNLFSTLQYTNNGSPVSTGGNGNALGINMANVLLNGGIYNDATGDSGFQLKNGSPALGAGFNGEDCGAFGGVSPYKLALQATIPSIYKLVIPPAAGTSMNVIISTKSNN